MAVMNARCRGTSERNQTTSALAGEIIHSLHQAIHLRRAVHSSQPGYPAVLSRPEWEGGDAALGPHSLHDYGSWVLLTARNGHRENVTRSISVPFCRSAGLEL